MSKTVKPTSALTNLTEDGLMELDSAGVVLYLNKPAETYLGLKVGDTAAGKCFAPSKRKTYRKLELGRRKLEITAKPNGDHMLFRIRDAERGPVGPLSQGSIQVLGSALNDTWLYLQSLFEDEFLMNDPERFDNACALFRNYFLTRRIHLHMNLYSLMRTESAPFHVREYNMYELCDGLAEITTVLMEKQGRRVRFTSRNGTYDGTGDTQLIETALLNLLTNALAHNSGKKDVLMHLSFDEKNYRVSVTNYGERLSAEDLERLFVPGGAPLSGGAYKSAGLGLSVSRDIALRHSGTLLANPKTEDEVTFIFSIPKINPEPLSLYCPPSSFTEHDMMLPLTELAPVVDRSNYCAKFFD